MFPTLRQLYNYDKEVLSPLVTAVKLLHPKHDTYGDDFVTELIDRCGDFGVIYSTPDSMHRAVKAWVGVNKGVWLDLAKTTRLEYDPIYNYDRYEQNTEEREVSDNGRNTANGRSVNSGTSAVNGSGTERELNSANATDEEQSLDKVAAYNSENTVVKGGAEHTLHKTSEGENSGEYESNSNSTFNGENISENNGEYNRQHNEKFSRTVRAYGNIGVTTSQEMLESERRVVRFNLWNTIINQFEERFCILVY